MGVRAWGPLLLSTSACFPGQGMLLMTAIQLSHQKTWHYSALLSVIRMLSFPPDLAEGWTKHPCSGLLGAHKEGSLQQDASCVPV